MCNIRFVESSLLYGYSVLWTASQFQFPNIWWPNFHTTRSRYLLLDVPKFKEILSGKKWPLLKKFSRQAQVILLLLRYLIMLTYLTYLATLTVLYFATQKRVLISYGITRETELSYKALYYAPLLHVSKQYQFNQQQQPPCLAIFYTNSIKT